MKLQVFRYKFPFSESFRTASVTFENREGVIIRLSKEGITALGEASPLPGFSNENLEQVIHEFQSKERDIQAHFSSSFSLQGTYEFLKLFGDVPSLQFGLFTTAASFLAQKEGCSLQQLLFQKDRLSIPINAVLGSESQDRLEKIDQVIKEGYHTIKLKIDSSFPKFLRLIEKIRFEHPDINIRIDANQSWSLNQAKNYLSKLQPYSIDYCEEPLSKPDIPSIKILNEQCGIPVALDESVFNSISISQLLDLNTVIILKPMVWGNKILDDKAKKVVNNTGRHLVFTTSLESGIGRLMTATLAAGMGDSTRAHGLNTGQMLANDIWQDQQFIQNGRFQLPDATQLKKLMNTKLLNRNLQVITIGDK